MFRKSSAEPASCLRALPWRARTGYRERGLLEGVVSIHGASSNAPDLGALIRGRRNARRPRMTQVQLGELIGYSESWVSRLESGAFVPEWNVLLVIARVLDLTPEELGLVTPAGRRPDFPMGSNALWAPCTATRVTAQQALQGPEDQEDDAVRRRRFLAGAVGFGAALTAGPAAASPSVGHTGPAAALEKALFELPSVEPLPLDRLRLALHAARRDFRAARYDTLGEELPTLLAAAAASRDSLTGYGREQAEALLARTYVLASELAVKVHSDTAWVTADRALSAAKASGAPAPLGEASRVLAIAMRRSGRGHAAADFLTRTATSFDAEHGTPEPQALAVRTSLLLTAAYSAAQAGDRTTALTLADEAETSATRLPARPGGELFTVDATPAQCALYRIGIHNTLGTPDEALPYARSLDPSRFPTPERRARAYTDTARMWHHLGDHRRTYAALRAVEHHAPEEARRPSIQSLTADLTYSSTNVPGLKEFATRTGAA